MQSSQQHAFFLSMCLRLARKSRDPKTRVGAVIVASAGQVLGTGFNRFPDGIAYTDERLQNRDVKLKLMVHAEMSAICTAARHGQAIAGATMYLCATDDSGAVWGGPPCASTCMPHVIESGIGRIVTYPFKGGQSNWSGELKDAAGLMAEAGIEHLVLPAPILREAAVLLAPPALDSEQA